MPITIGQTVYTNFARAVAAIRRRKGKKRIANPEAYVATIERKQHPKGK